MYGYNDAVSEDIHPGWNQGAEYDPPTIRHKTGTKCDNTSVHPSQFVIPSLATPTSSLVCWRKQHDRVDKRPPI